MFGERGCGKSSLWNALLQPPGQGNNKEFTRLLPTRPFGTCSAVPVEMLLANDEVGFRVEYYFDTDFVTALVENTIEGDRVTVRHPICSPCGLLQPILCNK